MTFKWNPGCGCCDPPISTVNCCDDSVVDPPSSITYTVSGVVGTDDTGCGTSCSDLYNVSPTLTEAFCQWGRQGIVGHWPCVVFAGCNFNSLFRFTNARIFLRGSNYILEVIDSLNSGTTSFTRWEYDFGTTQPDCATVFNPSVFPSLISHTSFDDTCCDFSAAVLEIST